MTSSGAVSAVNLSVQRVKSYLTHLSAQQFRANSLDPKADPVQLVAEDHCDASETMLGLNSSRASSSSEQRSKLL